MWRADDRYFKDLVEECGNTYLAVLFISNKARNILRDIDATLPESAVITWALTGVAPVTQDEIETRKRRDPDLRSMEDYLCYVDDETIKDEVRRLYKESVRNRHLCTEASSEISEMLRSRIRVILRMIWYSETDSFY